VRGRPAGCDGPSSRFVWTYSLVWAIETMLDPLCTGPLTRALGLTDELAGTALMFVFVLLGDLRVFVLVFGLAGDRGWLARAAGFTLVVPAFAGLVYGGLGLLAGELHGQVLWLAHETGFAAMALYLSRRWIPDRVPAHAEADGVRLRGMLRACVAYAATYYVLWACADLVILAGLDEGWALRIVPNQLYYGLWVPFVAWRWFAEARPSRPVDAAS